MARYTKTHTTSVEELFHEAPYLDDHLLDIFITKCVPLSMRSLVSDICEEGVPLLNKRAVNASFSQFDIHWINSDLTTERYLISHTEFSQSIFQNTTC